MEKKFKIVTFAGGCFWCQDAVFRMVKGVKKVTAGYSGGETENPNYEQVSTGTTGHMEAVQVEYDSTQVNYNDLLEIFWASHNPTQKGGQGGDIGSQYEAAIFYHTQEQKKLAEASKKSLEDKKLYKEPIATKILPFKNFYPAEDYHQDYYRKNQGASYCRVVISPKVEKVAKLFQDKIK